jgi:CheY-like chemotaxis protein
MKSVYIIDDDQDIVDAATIVLKSSGYRVGFQNDEDNLIENITSFKPDIIILDVIFPENSTAGFEMSRLIKANSLTKHIPILMLSAVNEKGRSGFTFSNRDRDEAFLPVEEFVEKPIQPDELLKKVALLIKSVK